jgi:uncharacterized membrane protein YccC
MDQAIAALTASNELLQQQADEIGRLKTALQEIADQHIPSQPMALAEMSELEWALRQYRNLRKIARDALTTA